MKILLSDEPAELLSRLKREGFDVCSDTHEIPEAAYHFAYKAWSHLGHDRAHMEALMHGLTHPDHGPLFTAPTSAEVGEPASTPPSYLALDVAWKLAVLLILLFLATHAHAQHGTSRIDVIKWQNQGSTIGVFAAPFIVNFTGAGVACSRSGGTVTCTVTGGSITNNPGGSNTQLQFNDSAAFGGIPSFTYVKATPLLTLQGGAKFSLVDTTDATKAVQFDMSGITTATTRTVKVPDAASSFAQAIASVAHNFLTSFSAATGAFTQARPVCGDLSDSSGGCTMSTTAGGDLSGTLPSPNVVSTHLSAALPINQGGTAQTSVPGSSGQLLFNNAGTIGAEDPIVSYNYVNLWTAQDVTVTRTSSAVRVSTFGAYGSLLMTWAGITGSPATCTVQIKSGDSQGNLINNGSALSVTPSNGTTSQVFASAATIPTQAQMQAVFACGTYPTAGTLTLDFVPGIVVSVGSLPALPAGSNLIGKVGIDQSTPGTTNGVQVNAALPAGSNTIGKADMLGNSGVALDAATGAAPPANALLNAGLGSGATGGLLTGTPVADSYVPINISTATTVLLVTGVSGRKVRIGAVHMVAAGADNVALIEGTGATCGTGTAGLGGGTTAASGYNFAANGGMALGSGNGTVIQTATAGDSVCITTSAAVQLSGGMQYAIY